MSSGNHLVHPNAIQGQSAQHWARRDFVKSVSALAGAAGLSAYMRPAAAEPPPETTRIRLLFYPVTCIAPQYVAEPLLKTEGFTNIQYLSLEYADSLRAVGVGKADLDLLPAASLVVSLDSGAPTVALAGLHLGCYELFGTERVRAIRDLKGKTVPVESIGGSKHVLLSSMAAYVGLDPRKDINWAIHSSADGIKLFAEGNVDAFLGFPPEPQEMRAKQIGRVIVNTATDRPWSEYYCCMLHGNRDFVQKYPAATKRAVRALLKAADLCAQQPERAARILVDRGITQHYDFALEALKEVRYNAWRTYDPDNTLRFHALRLHEVGMIKSSPQKIIAQGTDWRFLNELKRELKA
jgi:NitT/TauT family transport system substrate-binding protein